MNDALGNDPDLEDVFAAGVSRGEFATVEDARASFWDKIDRSIAEADAGDLHEIETVRASLHERFTHWPRAAE